METVLELDYLAIGERMRNCRRARKFSQGVLASHCGITASFIGHIERAEKVPSVETLARLSQVLEVTTDYLLFGVKWHCVRENCPMYSDIQALMMQYGINQ